MRFAIILLGLLGANVLVAEDGALAEGGSQPNSLCELQSQQSDFEGKLIRIEATYATDMHHFGLLLDDRCPNAEFDFRKPNAEARDDSIEQFENAVLATFPARGLVKFRVDLSGTFKRARGRQRPSIVANRVWSFERIVQ